MSDTKQCIISEEIWQVLLLASSDSDLKLSATYYNKKLNIKQKDAWLKNGYTPIKTIKQKQKGERIKVVILYAPTEFFKQY